MQMKQMDKALFCKKTANHVLHDFMIVTKDPINSIHYLIRTANKTK